MEARKASKCVVLSYFRLHLDLFSKKVIFSAPFVLVLSSKKLYFRLHLDLFWKIVPKKSIENVLHDFPKNRLHKKLKTKKTAKCFGKRLLFVNISWFFVFFRPLHPLFHKKLKKGKSLQEG
mgnify:CR=1 FL=1